ncbi:MAG: pilus assembly protein N-terminal domain-containing protein [Pirellulaceae bacterium]|nr:pilus assembly protein N-terminal domain-containing protein [Pirellulaceae bacterium]
MNWPSTSCPQPVTLPNVPVRTPRPAEGDAPELQWQTGVHPATPPTAGFIEPLRGNDAVIQVIVGQARLLTLRADLVNEQGTGVVAVADPTVVDFDIMPNPRVLRLTARRAGVTDLSITTADGEIYGFEVHVVYDLALLNAQLRQIYPDVQLRLFQIREHLAVEGQVRSIRQADQVLKTIEVFLASVQVPSSAQGQDTGATGGSGRGARADAGSRASQPADEGQASGDGTQPSTSDRPGAPQAVPEPGGRADVQGTFVSPQIINLLRVPGVHQVMLQVQIAELNRTALRNIGADWRWEFGAGNILTTLIGGDNTTVTGVFPSANLEVVLRALRTNSLVSVLAEPNLVAMSGQKAQFLAGGEIPIPTSTITGGTTNISIEWRQFGVSLEFEPFVLEDEAIRLTVTPEESTLDYANALIIEGITIPATTNRRVTTTVEMRQGQTLAMAGLLRVAIDANTKRIPGLGDLPYIGPLFSNTTHSRQEKELLVLVTPYLVAPMNPDEVPCLPTDGITDPNDLEFYLLNRIEGRTGREFYPTREWDDPWGFRYLMHLEQSNCCGPVGFSPME